MTQLTNWQKTRAVLLNEAVDGLWKRLPEPRLLGRMEQDALARSLLPFVTLQITANRKDERGLIVIGRNDLPVYAMIVHIGLPAVPALLDGLAYWPDTKELKVHRETLARCLIDIYERGGEGRIMATQRLKLFAEEQVHAAQKERVLAAVEYIARIPVFK